MVNRPLAVILATVSLEAVGYGLAMPVIPGLLRELSHESRIAGQFGYFIAIYPLMQFLASPVLGRLSDRFGRRPVLLGSMAGAAIDYAVMGLSPLLAVVYLGRVLAGVTGAGMAVATAYIADISEEGDRARRFGLMNACFGAGFVAGPILGGIAGSFSPRYPFLLAALFNAANLAVAYFLLPESRHPDRAPADPKATPRFASLGTILADRAIRPLLATYTLIWLVGQIPHALWVVNGEDRFGWDVRTIGMTYAVFGVLHAIAQAFCTEPAVKLLGERGAIVVGVAADAFALVAMALIDQGWMVYPLMVPFTIAGIAQPALQSMLSNRVDEARQGELQGTLVSLTSVTEVFGPILATSIYAASPASSRGAVWLMGAGLYAVCFPFLLRGMAGTAAKPADDLA